MRKAVWNMLCNEYGRELAEFLIDVASEIAELPVTVRGADDGMVLRTGGITQYVPNGFVASGEIDAAPQ